MQGGGEAIAFVEIYGALALVVLLGILVHELVYNRRLSGVIEGANKKIKEQKLDDKARLTQRIQEATAELTKANDELKRVDATKDEFVSMASHQLRTPLTSIKGYISMVLEGDAGEINADQRKLLNEAFTSSERMVRLIGDFLNVSRLQNGKFMIDRTAIDLPAVVAQEIATVQEIATGKGIGIAFHQPSRYPRLYLDEEKIRQVIMNFLDNAVYYSPESKVVSVRLYTSEGFAVFEVVDRGMGVPKAAQRHLFTKFFRADNALKQRPDGTGVGLYLAKKVIDGHGGKVFFESAEHQGSTFGFRLPIKKLSLPPSVE